MKLFSPIVAFGVALLFTGCIVRDEVTTLIIQPDGSATLMMFHSNIRSTTEGVKGARELDQYIEDFNARQSPDFTRIIQAGGEVLDARLVRPEYPCASIITAEFPSMRTLEKYCSIEGEDEKLQVKTQYSTNGILHKLTTLISLPENVKLPGDHKEAHDNLQGNLQGKRGTAFSETRIIVVGGRIASSQGWTVASDRRSALLSVEEVIRLMRDNPDQVELFIEWELNED